MMDMKIILRIALFLVSAAMAGAAERPNVLVVIGDDHAAHALGAYGNKLAKTPNLDRLAASGMRFDRAYCNAPVCTASRQSFLTGRYPRTLGVTQLQSALPASEVTLAEVLGTRGYATAAIGKMHFNSSLTHGFRVVEDLPQHAEWLKSRAVRDLPPGIETLGPWRPFKVPAREWLNSMCWPYPAMEADMASHYFVEETAKFIAEKREGPFFCVASFYEPHSPFQFPVEFRGRRKPSDFDPPAPGPEDAWQIPKIFQPLTREDKQGIAAAYYTSVEYLDSNVGKVLDALEASGKAGNTVVVYFGDNGYFLGQHGRFEKHSMFEEAVRVPLLVRFPPLVKPGSTTDALVELFDLFPTLAELCGAPSPEMVQGKSLRAILDGTGTRHRDHIFVEYSENEEGMVRDERWKLIYGTGKRARKDGYEIDSPTPGRYILLYDTVNDERELKNLSHDPEQKARVARMVHILREHMESTSRQPDLLPKTDDDFAMLDFCLQPRDVGSK